MNVVEKKLAELQPYAKNPRKNDQAVPAVAESIRRFGWKQPLVIDKKGVIIAGHTRYKAAKSLGLKSVPCVVADDLTPEEAKAFRLVDNRVGELAEWDFDLLDGEISGLSGIGFDLGGMGFDFDWDEPETGSAEQDAAGGKEFFDRESRNDKSRQEGNDEYNEFLDKFDVKKTTDDCYTPDNIYNAVAAWVADEYQINAATFVRPFYPGGDYQNFKYPKDCVVVDNPPFSIFAEIVKFYSENGIKFFIFGPALTLCSGSGNGYFCAVCAGANVIYENGANICTSFATNLEGARIRSAPRLYQAITEANKKNLEKQHKQLPKYAYSDYVITAAMLNRFSKYGIEFSVAASESAFIRELDAQKENQKAVFGGGFLLSERKAAEKAAAEKAAEKAAAEKSAIEKNDATVWQLSEREWEIVRSLK